MPAGGVSSTERPATSLGPVLPTVTVYVVVPPGVSVATPFVLAIERNAVPLEASVAVATAGLVTLCALVMMPIGRVLTRLPAAVGLTLIVTVQMEPALIVM